MHHTARKRCVLAGRSKAEQGTPRMEVVVRAEGGSRGTTITTGPHTPTAASPLRYVLTRVLPVVCTRDTLTYDDVRSRRVHDTGDDGGGRVHDARGRKLIGTNVYIFATPVVPLVGRAARGGCGCCIGLASVDGDVGRVHDAGEASRLVGGSEGALALLQRHHGEDHDEDPQAHVLFWCVL